MTDAWLMDAGCVHGRTWWECPECENTAPCDHSYVADDGAEGRCECGYQWYPKGGPVADRHERDGLAAATRTIRAWLDGEDVQGPDLFAELDYWRSYFGAPLEGHDDHT
jgi:hypothetical protein